MKRIICLVLSVLMLASLCACGEPEVITETVEVPVIPDEYADLINAIESGDYDGAVEMVNAMRPEPEYEVIEVHLNMDNVFDYFELVDTFSYAEKKASGEYSHATLSTCIALKEKFSLPAEGEYVQRFEIGYTYLENAYQFDNIDFQNWTYEVKSRMEKDKTKGGTVRSLGTTTMFDTVDNYYKAQNGTNRIATEITKYIVGRPKDAYQYWQCQFNPEIVRAEGTLHLIVNK